VPDFENPYVKGKTLEQLIDELQGTSLPGSPRRRSGR
jgi:hypothetical protein